MYQKLLLGISLIIALISFPNAQDLNVAFAEIDLSKPFALSMENEKILALAVNTQAILQVDIVNKQDSTQDYLAIVEVRDSNDITSYLQFQKGKLPPNESIQIGISWTPTKTDNFQIRSFVLNSFENPIVLSAVTSTSLKVGKVTEVDTTESGNEQASSDVENKYPDKEPSLGNLVQYALGRINEDREKFGLAPVELSNNVAAQIHAEDNLKNKLISHWMSNGQKPYMTYTDYGGLGAVSQNVAMTGDYYSDKDCRSGFYVCEKTDPFKEIDQNEHGLVYDDLACCDNGHRSNILDKHHTHVSIGIAYDDYNFVMVQNFEDNYIEFDKPISKTRTYLQFSGDLSVADEVYGVYINYDETPTAQVYEQDKDNRSYQIGEIVAGVTSGGYYYEGIATITADTWSISGNSIDISFSVEDAVKERGVYTVSIVLVDKDGNQYPITNYSFSA